MIVDYNLTEYTDSLIGQGTISLNDMCHSYIGSQAMDKFNSLSVLLLFVCGWYLIDVIGRKKNYENWKLFYKKEWLNIAMIISVWIIAQILTWKFLYYLEL